MPKPEANQVVKTPSAKKIIKYANSSISQTLDSLDIPTFGLTEQYVASKAKNQTKKEYFPWFKYFLESFKDVFTLILVAIIIYNLVMYGLNPSAKDAYTYLAGALLVLISISISIMVTEYTNYGIWKGNQSFYNNHVETVKVLRNVVLNPATNPFANPLQAHDLMGHLTDVDAINLLRGDVFYLQPGDIVPADARIVYADNFYVSQELLTGLGIPVNKKYFNSSFSPNIFNLTDIIYRGSKVTSGTCWALSFSDLNKNIYNEQVEKIRVQESKSTFDDQVKRVTRILIYLLIIFVPTIFIMVGLLSGSRSGFSDSQTWISAVLFAMAVAIALSPDGLPMMLSAAFSRVRSRLAKKKIQIRELSSVQNIGSMNVLAIDGDKIFVDKDFHIQSIKGIDGNKNELILDYLLLSISVLPSANLELNNLLLKTSKYQSRLEVLKKRYIFINRSTNQNSFYLHFYDQKQEQELVIKRDKIDKALNLATLAMKKNNQVAELTSEEKLAHLYHDNRKGAFHSIGINYKYLKPGTKDYATGTFFYDDYIFLGRIDLLSSTKSGSSSIVKEIQHQDIKVLLFSKKSLGEVIALARELDFKIKKAVDGNEINNYTDKQLTEKIRDANVFFNLNLNGQTRIIRLFKKLNNTIGFLGADSEDSFQLLTADIGITLTNSDDFGKYCATLVINHLDLMQLITSIKESRIGLMNIVKYIKLKVTGTISLTLKMLFGILFFNHESISAIELLIQNMAYNVIEYTIIYDKINDQYLLKPSQWKTKSIIPFALSNAVILVGLNIVLTLILAFAFNPHLLGDIRQEQGGWIHQLQQIQTSIFIGDSISHIAFIFVARDNYARFYQSRPSKPLTIALITGVAFFLALPVIPKIQAAFDMVTPWWEFYLMLIGAMLILMIGIDFLKEIYFRSQRVWF